MTTVGTTRMDLRLTEFLFPRPSVLYGIARLVDLGAQLDSYNFAITPDEADSLALYSDVFMVGSDFRAAIHDWFQKHPGANMAAR